MMPLFLARPLGMSSESGFREVRIHGSQDGASAYPGTARAGRAWATGWLSSLLRANAGRSLAGDELMQLMNVSAIGEIEDLRDESQGAQEFHQLDRSPAQALTSTSRESVRQFSTAACIMD